MQWARCKLWLTTQHKKWNAIIFSCFRSVITALRSTPLSSHEVKCLCTFFEIRCKYLANTFFLKNMSSPNFILHKTFKILNTFLKHVCKTLLTLPSISTSFNQFAPIVFCPSIYLQLYDTSFLVLTHSSKKEFIQMFSAISHFPILVNSLFVDFIPSNILVSTLIFTDGLVSFNSAGFSYFIPKLNWSFCNKLLHFISSFTVEYYAVMSALR